MTLSRRDLLTRGAAGLAGGLALGGPLQALTARGALAVSSTGVAPNNGGYGPLGPVPDDSTGEVLLHLPTDFHYRSFGRTGAPMSDGVATPGSHDGMAAFPAGGGQVRLVRNHELRGGGAFGDTAKAYDTFAGGGTTTLEVSPHAETVASWVSLNGTNVNCAGGPSPWGSWITCEENVLGPDVAGAGAYTERHGYVYEVPSGWDPGEHVEGVPIRSAGRFQHEAVAFDPATGIMYMTEDPFFDGIGGFYRYTPPVAGRLDDGGVLEMLRITAVNGSAVSGSYDTRSGQTPGSTYDCTWVEIGDPDGTFPANTPDVTVLKHVFNQGVEQGGARFNRLEGAWYRRGSIAFNSTQGGDAGRGQVWVYDIASSKLKLLFESPGDSVLDLPDNLTFTSNGSLLLCEDGGGSNYLRGLTPDGLIFDFAKNAVAGFEGNEFAGACFSPRGGGSQELFVNIQTPGITFAIWGPFARGVLA
jgi:secreted PhoX family phosphatase